jgi:hypothetical protein
MQLDEFSQIEHQGNQHPFKQNTTSAPRGLP